MRGRVYLFALLLCTDVPQEADADLSDCIAMGWPPRRAPGFLAGRNGCLSAAPACQKGATPRTKPRAPQSRRPPNGAPFMRRPI